MRKRRLLTATLTAAVLAVPATALIAFGPSARDWSIGPIIRGENYSVNMPPTLRDTPNGPAFDFPYPTAAHGHVHYVTVPVRSLRGAERITLTYRIDTESSTRFLEQENPDGQATLSLYFQRSGDRWTRRTPQHRWYAPASKEMVLRPGVHTVSVALDEPWIAMMGGDARDHPEKFEAAKRETVRVGFTFGGKSGRGHGVFATAPARFTVLDFRIE